jgi:hypothetical protein
MNPQIFMMYNRAMDYSNDDSLPEYLRRAFQKIANLISEGNALQALEQLCQFRALEKLWKGNFKPFEESSDELAVAMISAAQSTDVLNQIKKSMGPWAVTPIPVVMFRAREISLKAISEGKKALAEEKLAKEI